MTSAYGRFAATLAVVATVAIGLAPSARAQEGEPAPSSAPRSSSPRLDGRGFLYGAFLSSPVYLSALSRAGDGAEIRPEGGAGVQAHAGWELPYGIVLEIQAGVGVNILDTEGAATKNTLTRVDLVAVARYALSIIPVVSPFVELRAGVRWLWFEWTDGVAVEGAFSVPLGGALGLHLDIAPYFSVDAGVVVTYAIPTDALGEGFVDVSPFLGATLFIFDEFEASAP